MSARPITIKDLASDVGNLVEEMRGLRSELRFYFCCSNNRPAKPQHQGHHLEVEEILNRIQAHFGYSRRQLLSRIRDRRLCFARHLAMLLVFEDLVLNYSEIARIFGSREHGSVRAGILSVQNRIATEKECEALYRLLSRPRPLTPELPFGPIPMAKAS